MNCMIDKSVEYKCAMEAFVNLVCYAVFSFAILVIILVRSLHNDLYSACS
jgi:hypothetical protein